MAVLVPHRAQYGPRECVYCHRRNSTAPIQSLRWYPAGMPPVGAERWFHTLVVVGASLTGCGGATTDKGMPAASGSGGALSTGGTSSGGTPSGGTPAGGAPTNPSMCADAAQFFCDDYPTRTNCRCDATAPRKMSDCGSPLDFQCTAPLCGGPSDICYGNDYVGCRCDPSGPRPSDCATPEQFFCNIERPFFYDCGCRPEAPPTSCKSPYLLCCQSDNPRFGCSCDCVGIK